MKHRIISNWSLCIGNDSPYIAPEHRILCIQGISLNHPTIKDGDYIRTSGIVGYDEGFDVFITETGSAYKLGAIDERYDQIYPNALETLKKQALALKKGESHV